MSELTIRAVTADDVDALLSLWQAAGLDHDVETDRAEIEGKLDYDGDLFLIMLDGDQPVATVMGTWDGHRGRIKRCGVHPDQQGRGLGRQVVAELERRFHARGITELRLEVWSDNTGALAFWTEMGWEHLDEIRYFTRSIAGSENSG